MITFPFDTIPKENAPIEVAPNIFWLRLSLPWVLDHVNVYLLEDPDGWTIIDTGLGNENTIEVWNVLLAGLLKEKPITRVIITHFHPDHIGLAGWFQQEHDIPIYTSRTTWLLARSLYLDQYNVPSKKLLTFYKHMGMNAETFETRKKERPFQLSDTIYEPALGYHRLQDGGEIKMGGYTWLIKTGDGHAPEHLTFWCIDMPIVIAGDQILPGISSNLSVNVMEPDANPVKEWIASCKKFQKTAKPDHLVLPGHKLPFIGLEFRLNQLISGQYSALDRLAKSLTSPKTAEECFPALYKRKIGSGEYGLALTEAYAHLNCLYHDGKVSRTLDENEAYQWQLMDETHD